MEWHSMMFEGAGHHDQHPRHANLHQYSHLTRFARLSALALLFAFIPGVCWSYRWGQPAPRLPNDALRVPLLRQAAPYSCGAAVTQAILAYWGAFDGGESVLYEALDCTAKDGTEPPSIVRVAMKYGLDASLREHQMVADLRKGLASGYTIVVNLQAWRDAKATPEWRNAWEDGHYVVLVGMDDYYAYAMDPSTLGAYTYLPIPELAGRWHDYESRRGFRKEYQQLAIYIRGKTPHPPGALVRLE
jgi:predicted double-glycine peptidase